MDAAKTYFRYGLAPLVDSTYEMSDDSLVAM